MEVSSGIDDDLVRRVRERALDPARRLAVRPNAFLTRIQAMDVGQLFAAIQRQGAELRDVVADNRAGRIDPVRMERIRDLEREMRGDAILPPVRPVDPPDLALAEAALGFALPSGLRRIYLEVGDGGFGPGTGLLSVREMAARYATLLDEVPRNQRWPDRLIPLVDDGVTITALDSSREAGAVIAWDPEDLDEQTSDRRWQRSFAPVARSLAAWLEAWVASEEPASTTGFAMGWPAPPDWPPETEPS